MHQQTIYIALDIITWHTWVGDGSGGSPGTNPTNPSPPIRMVDCASLPICSSTVSAVRLPSLWAAGGERGYPTPLQTLKRLDKGTRKDANWQATNSREVSGR